MPADPKNYAKTAPDDDADTLQEQLDALKAQLETVLASKAASTDDDRLEKILLRVAQMSADAHERAANPSNKTHPAISVFSYPEGDRARPREPLKCEMFWCGYPIEMDTTTAEEISLLNQGEIGVFQFQRYNHRATVPSVDKLTITGERDGTGKLSRLLYTFPTNIQENRDTSKVDILRTAFGVKSPEQLELDALRREVERLRAPETVSA
jgi:hypothetical protein